LQGNTGKKSPPTHNIPRSDTFVTFSIRGGRPPFCTEVWVGSSLLSAKKVWDTLLRGKRKVVVLSDLEVFPLWKDRIEESFSTWSPLIVLIPPGEKYKSREMKNLLEDTLLSWKVGRDGIVVAVGGGVVGDLGGFLSGTYFRGIPFVLVPTTLLSMVDSALGGKTGVDHPLGKNLIGVFHFPVGLLADISFLTTLPDSQFRYGLVEAIKHSVCLQGSLFLWIQKHLYSLFSRNPEKLTVFVEKNLRIKGSVVKRDPLETDLRQILNFGHTVGHAIEQVSHYTIPHGEAVSLGIVVELDLAEQYRGFPREEKGMVISLLRRSGFSLEFPSFSCSSLLSAMERDKKVREGKIRFSLPSRIGKYPPHPEEGYAISVPLSAVEKVLSRYFLS
jgi:3-dehydroquinate synthase